jgi:hypothetical protein
MLAGSAMAIATPANAQSGFGFHFGNSAYGGSYYGNQGFYGDRGYSGNRGYEQSGGVWRWDPYLHRRVWITSRFSPGRWSGDRYDRDYDRDDYRGWDRGYRGR